MEGNTKLEAFCPKDELENIFVYFCCFQGYTIKQSFVVETNTQICIKASFSYNSLNIYY